MTFLPFADKSNKVLRWCREGAVESGAHSNSDPKIGISAFMKYSSIFFVISIFFL